MSENALPMCTPCGFRHQGGADAHAATQRHVDAGASRQFGDDRGFFTYDEHGRRVTK